MVPRAEELASVPAGIQALEAVGTVTKDDYDRVFAPLVDRARRAGGRMRLLYQFGPGFERITPGALWADTRLGWASLALLDGCAVVSDIDWVRSPARGIGAWMPCPMRVYDNEEFDGAVAWLASLPSGADVSRLDMAKAFVGGSLASVGSLAGIAISRAPKRSRE
ncbi:STAS/SEC14 domain-containing protein [Mycobacterium alsense]|uniref:STAS/SEC14 domain-containing protein n=1 Tax=Mycobacterium alsense TaxID=324058 RepID=A0ABX3R1U7_9MYCO|nr:STAS/SEC14 domain-containing protein [Mycobacterium alsense]